MEDNLIKEYFVQEIGYDKFRKTATYRSTRGDYISGRDRGYLSEFDIEYITGENIELIRIYGYNLDQYTDLDFNLEFLLNDKDIVNLASCEVTRDFIYWECDISLLLKLSIADKIEFRITGGKYKIEKILDLKNALKFKGFYNALFDPEFLKTEIATEIQTIKAKDEKERNELEEKYKKQEITRKEEEIIIKEKEEKEIKGANRLIWKVTFVIYSLIVLFFIFVYPFTLGLSEIIMLLVLFPITYFIVLSSSNNN